MTWNGVIALFCKVISRNSTALQADYVTVVEDRPIMPVEYRLSFFGQNWPTLQCGFSAKTTTKYLRDFSSSPYRTTPLIYFWWVAATGWARICVMVRKSQRQNTKRPSDYRRSALITVIQYLQSLAWHECYLLLEFSRRWLYQSCPSVGLTYALGLVGLGRVGSRFFRFQWIGLGWVDASQILFLRHTENG